MCVKHCNAQLVFFVEHPHIYTAFVNVHYTSLFRVRWELIQEEKAIMAALAKGDNDKLDTRLGEVHAELAVIGAASGR